MDERFFTRLSILLEHHAVVVASVLDTRGATPRKAGSRMLVTTDSTEFSVGGGLAEARVIDAARTLLASDSTGTAFDIDLTGQPESAGICGGRMQFALRRWAGADDLAQAAHIASTLRDGRRVTLDAAALGSPDDHRETLQPDPRLLIVGGGHCSLALFELAQALDFDRWVFDPRPHYFGGGAFDGGTLLHGDYALLDTAFDSERPVFACLLNRDYGGDVESLRVLQHRRPAFLGMMGSRRRVAAVRAAFAADAWPHLHAPIGLPIEAHTPHEIAISILAQLIAERRRKQA